jgi:hypothetical protein
VPFVYCFMLRGEKPPDGDPPVRFGGRGGESLSYPYQSNQ